MPKRHFAACGPWWLQPAEPLAGARVLEGREVAAKLSPSTVRGGSGGGGRCAPTTEKRTELRSVGAPESWWFRVCFVEDVEEQGNRPPTLH